MSDDTPKPPTAELPPELQPMNPEELSALLSAAGVVPGPASDNKMPGKGSLKKKLIVASLIAAVGLGASIMSCVGQSFSYRQAHALEGIEQQLKEIRGSCPEIVSPAAPPRP